MGKLQDEIYIAIGDVYHTKAKAREILKLVKSDIQKEKYKDVSDEVVLTIIKNFVSNAKEMLTYFDKDDKKYIDNRRIIEVLEPFIPKIEKVSDEEIRDFINNMDLSIYKNKIQAMKPIMKHFGNTADGNTVKNILLNIDK